MANKIDMSCSFCGRTQTQTKKLISSPDGNSFICEDCVNICKDMLKDETKFSDQSKIDLPTPEEL